MCPERVARHLVQAQVTPSMNYTQICPRPPTPAEETLLTIDAKTPTLEVCLCNMAHRCPPIPIPAPAQLPPRARWRGLLNERVQVSA